MAYITSVRLGKPILKDLVKLEKAWQADRSEVVRRLLVQAIQEWKIQDCLNKISSHEMSLGKLAEVCGLSIWQVLELVKEKNIDWTGYTQEDFEKDIGILKNDK